MKERYFLKRSWTDVQASKTCNIAFSQQFVPTLYKPRTGFVTSAAAAGMGTGLGISSGAYLGVPIFCYPLVY